MRIVKSNKTVKASTNLEPRERTTVDGKTWWVVFDKDTQKYSTLTCFGKYKSKKDCQYAIDKYNEVGACNDVKASNNGKSYKECLKDALIAKGGYRKSELEDQETRTLESWAKDAGIDINTVCACGDIKASKKLSADEQALTHIKAAIDILGKSGNKDDVTKDSIANLGVVMLDLKSKK